jgi:hypothetical protein
MSDALIILVESLVQLWVGMGMVTLSQQGGREPEG